MCGLASSASLAATTEVSVDIFSCRYLDDSFRDVKSHYFTLGILYSDVKFVFVEKTLLVSIKKLFGV